VIALPCGTVEVIPSSPLVVPDDVDRMPRAA
jgi:hypothetical protein